MFLTMQKSCSSVVQMQAAADCRTPQPTEQDRRASPSGHLPMLRQSLLSKLGSFYNTLYSPQGSGMMGLRNHYFPRAPSDLNSRYWAM